MMKIYFATRVRGFFKHLFAEPTIDAVISYSNNSIYELNNWKQRIVRIIARKPIFDTLGLIRAINARNADCDVYGSFNRFLKADKPYFVYVENPTALYHYRLDRGKSYLGHRKVCNMVNDSNLKHIVCMSQACKNTFEKLCCKLDDPSKLTQIYPLVPENPHVDKDMIIQRCHHDKEIKLLYIAQGIRFLSKGALEILKAFKDLKNNGYDELSLTMVTSLSDISPDVLSEISSVAGINLLDFNLSYEDMQQLYASHNIFLMPTSDDSFNLTVLEAIKAGLPVIGSTLYAIPEMVKDSYNGYLTEPAYYFFDKECMPNPQVWNNRKETIYSGTCNERVAAFLYEKIEYLFKNREKLSELSINSLNKANSAPFSRVHIVNQWNQILSDF